MIPVNVAFHGSSTSALATLDDTVADGLLSHARTFCPPLFEIMTAADTIRRVVWNGQVMTAGQRGELLKLKTILDQISETGNRSNELFSQSIRDLYETVLASSLCDSEFVSHLLVDLLDRNLYERSNDCRWWALTPELRSALASNEKDMETIEGITAILDYINRLYTVYTRIFVYDLDGRIIASTNPLENGVSIVGTTIGGATLAGVRALRNEQQYYVTPFEPTSLYGGRSTYVYHAAIRDPHNEAVIVGGIGIVFDSESEFAAMLHSALGGKEEVKAFFIDRSGMIIASTDSSRAVGTPLDIDPALLRLENGRSASRIVLHDDHYAIMGCTVSEGYREFKVADGYSEDVIAVVFDLFGEVRDRGAVVNRIETVVESDMSGGGREYASFFIDGMLFAIPAECVQEALPASEIAPVSMGGRPERIGVLSQQRVGENRNFVWVFDLRHLMRGKPSDIAASSQVIIVRHGNQDIGLLVDELHGVPEFRASQIVPTPFAATADGLLVKQVIQANEGRLLIQSLDIVQLFACLKDASLPTVLDLGDVQRLTGGSYADAVRLTGEAA